MRPILWLAVLSLLAGTGACGAKPELSAKSAWVRLSPPGSASAAYLTVVNRLDVPVQLTAARAAGFGSVAIHETRIVDGQARMVHATPLLIPARGQVAFSPGGLHLMLMQPQAELTAGATVTIQLLFDGREPLSVDAVVRPVQP